MSLDPLPIFGRIRVPTLLFNGSCDEWIPVDESLVNWRSLGVPNLETVVIEGAAHDMTMPSGQISPIYADSLKRWLAAHA
jgi:alpha-beta hydrolase superfamily lysophospholipase